MGEFFSFSPPPLGALFGMGPSDELAGEKEKKEDI